MKSYVLFFAMLVSILCASQATADEATAEKELHEVDDCLKEGATNSGLDCINKISVPLYQDLKTETTEFVKKIQDHVERWAHQEVAKKAKDNNIKA